MAFGKWVSRLKKAAFFLTFISPLLLFALETKPWLGNVYEWEAQGVFTYSRYSKVDDASVQLSHPSNDKFYAIDLSFTPSESFDFQGEMEFADTPRQKLGLQSYALQARYLWLSDIRGDAYSLISGFSIREASRRSLHDVSCPYHSDFNFELTTAAGKEWSKEGWWTSHGYTLLGLGIANHGAPWLKALAVFEVNRTNRNQLMVALEGYFGFGGERHPNVDHFDGWGHFHHQSIDCAVGYAHHLPVWGTFGLRYAYRLFANTFPAHVNFITLFYRLPFSLF